MPSEQSTARDLYRRRRKGRNEAIYGNVSWCIKTLIILPILVTNTYRIYIGEKKLHEQRFRVFAEWTIYITQYT